MTNEFWIMTTVAGLTLFPIYLKYLAYMWTKGIIQADIEYCRQLQRQNLNHKPEDDYEEDCSEEDA